MEILSISLTSYCQVLGGVSAEGDRAEVQPVRNNVRHLNVFVKGLKIRLMESDALEVQKMEGGP